MVNSIFPPCIWLLGGFCLELYLYCLNLDLKIVFFQPWLFSLRSGQECVCVCGVEPKTTPKAEKGRLEKKMMQRLRFKHRDTITVGAKHRGKILLYTDPTSFRGSGVIQIQLLRIFFLFIKIFLLFRCFIKCFKKQTKC